MYYENIDWEMNEKALLAMEEKVHLLLQSYCGVSKEEVEGMKTMSAAKRAVLLEEAVLHE